MPLAHTIINKNPGHGSRRAGVEETYSWISPHVLQHIDGGKQVVV
jgi:hypothetical protein